MYSKTLKTSQENTCTGVSLLIKLQPPYYIFKMRLRHMCISMSFTSLQKICFCNKIWIVRAFCRVFTSELLIFLIKILKTFQLSEAEVSRKFNVYVRRSSYQSSTIVNYSQENTCVRVSLMKLKANFIKKRFQKRCFLVNIAKFL